MTRYDQMYSILAERAVDQGRIDVATFIQQHIATGASVETIAEELIRDLEEDGPIFGKFLRSITGAANSAVMTAARQGEHIGAISDEQALGRMRRIAGQQGSVAAALGKMDPTTGRPILTDTGDPRTRAADSFPELEAHYTNALQNADPESAAVIEDLVLGEQQYTWICALRKTCHRCLPLHGRKMKLADWQALGMLPENIHSGWDSSCYCRLVSSDLAEAKQDLKAPLRRVPTVKGSKRSQRSITEKDVITAQDARDKALETIEGRRMLRRLGQAGLQEGG